MTSDSDAARDLKRVLETQERYHDPRVPDLRTLFTDAEVIEAHRKRFGEPEGDVPAAGFIRMLDSPVPFAFAEASLDTLASLSADSAERIRMYRAAIMAECERTTTRRPCRNA
jgi:hypothetical protein